MEEIRAEYKLENMRIEHRDLDVVIEVLDRQTDKDNSQIYRLKKRKLAIKDRIIELELAINNAA